jgi:hypothetical protein
LIGSQALAPFGIVARDFERFGRARRNRRQWGGGCCRQAHRAKRQETASRHHDATVPFESGKANMHKQKRREELY